VNQCIRGVALLSGLLLTLACAADDSETSLGWSAGVETSRGDFGGDVDIEDLYVPITFTVEGERIAVDLTVPYLSVRAPVGTTVIDPGGEPVPGSGERVTESGLGDVVLALTVYDVFYSPERDLALDLSAGIKFGTADYDKGLGTGETDFTVIADLVKYLDNGLLIASAGYRFRGDPADYDLEDVAIASFGGTFSVSDKSNAGIFLDFRESSIAGEDAITELSMFLSRRLAENRALQFYLFKGFSDSTAEWGAGIIYRVM
jgi:hypothetical protein